MLRIVNNLHLFIELRVRHYSVKQARELNIKDTLNLPKTKFPQRLNSAKRVEVESALIEGSFTDLYHFQHQKNKDPEFVLHDGPPYANGELHMGHAVNKVLKDITLRKHVINGRKINYIPGWDCHGLPIELKAMKGRRDVSSLDIRSRSREYALKTIEEQRNGFRNMGVLADWKNSNNIYKTVDLKYIDVQLRTFLDLYQKQLVFRDLKPVFWSPSSKTALAEAELEYDANFVSPSVIVRFHLKTCPKLSLLQNSDKVYCLVWTTTPWTLPSNQAICYNPELEYSLVRVDDSQQELYIIATELVSSFQETTNKALNIISKIQGSQLSSSTYVQPFNQNEAPLLPAKHVQEKKGTGLVHTAPAHGHDDFLVSIANNIPVKCFVNEEGKYTEDAPLFLRDKSINEGNDIVLNYLQKDIVYSGNISHSYPIDWRTKEPVIIRASEQWFINTDKIKDQAIEELKNINVYPEIHSEANKKVLVEQLQKRPYWCISRQRSWGVPIPVLYKKNTKEIVVNEEIINHICGLLKNNGNIDFWWSCDVKDLVPRNVLKQYCCTEYDLEKGKDIFDIWFDSGISWNVALNGNKVADLYLEGADQFTGWFQASLLTSVACRNIAPYRSIFVHGFTVDEKGHKMSKFLGNIISPKDIVEKYGIDTLRWWVASHGTQHTSITVSDHLFKGATETLSKVRSTLRYLNGIIREKQQEDPNLDYNSLTHLDKYILNELYHFEREAEDLYRSYQYNKVIALIQNFVANQMSSIYLHLVKDRLYCGTDEEYERTRKVLVQNYFVLSKVLWPIIPFMVEESWSHYDSDPFYKLRVAVPPQWNNQAIANLFDSIFDLRQIVNQNVHKTNTWFLNCKIECNPKLLTSFEALDLKNSMSSELCEILQVSNVELVPNGGSDAIDVTLTAQDAHLCVRCRRFLIDVNGSICKRCEKIISQKL